MKSRKILTVLSLVSLLVLQGCKYNKEEKFYFNENEEQQAGTTKKLEEIPVIIETTSDYEILPDETDKDVGNQKNSVTTVGEGIALPETCFPAEYVSTEELPSSDAENTTEEWSYYENTETVEVEETQTSEEVNETPPIEPLGYSELPQSILSTVEYWESVYPNMNIGVGIYSLDNMSGYEYNTNFPINSACTIKAAYALFVLKECEKREDDIWTKELTYLPKHYDSGSGNIKNEKYGTTYTIAELINLLLRVSDNVAYNMLLDEYTLNDFYISNSALGGESDWAKWGKATVNQRKNEWIAIWNYVNSGSQYSQVLRDDLTGTQFAYFVEGMQGWHSYMQKSGWTDDCYEYPATGEAAIIDDSYLIVVLTEDYSYGSGHIDVLQSIGGAVENFIYVNGYIF